ncbi:MAG: DUF2785 domain-containing protein [Bacillota bacterium]
MYNEKNQLKMNLTRIRDNNYDLAAGENVSDYLKVMLKYIGDTDFELRDRLIYLTLMHWIEDKGYFNSEELCSLLNTILSEDFMFFNIGSEGDDSVFKRSFSVLLINPIVCVHLNEAFLAESLVLKTKDCLIRYLHEEKDLRGYDNVKGWAHAIAHAADGLNVLLVCDGITEDHCKEVLKAIESKVFEGKSLLGAEEDERLVNVIYYSIMENGLLSSSYICSWLERLSKVIDIEDRITRYIARVNAKNIARSLYYRMKHVKDYADVSNTVFKLEKKLNIYID